MKEVVFRKMQFSPLGEMYAPKNVIAISGLSDTGGMDLALKFKTKFPGYQIIDDVHYQLSSAAMDEIDKTIFVSPYAHIVTRGRGCDLLLKMSQSARQKKRIHRHFDLSPIEAVRTMFKEDEHCKRVLEIARAPYSEWDFFEVNVECYDRETLFHFALQHFTNWRQRVGLLPRDEAVAPQEQLIAA
jgi:hypothetical protein